MRIVTPWIKPRVSRGQWAERLLPAATIRRPEGDGPWPLVLQMHGCGGLRPLQAVYAERAVQAGYAVMTIDSFKPRGLSRVTASLTVCTGLALHGAERAADLFALYDWARHQSWVDHRHIVACGWSHGGWTIMDALAMGTDAAAYTGLTDLPPRPLDGLAGAILIYPYASFPSLTRRRGWPDHDLPVFALLSGKDQVVGTRHPPAAFDHLEHQGLVVDRLILPDATHAFDDHGANDPRAVFRPDLREQAVDWYGRALEAIAK